LREAEVRDPWGETAGKICRGSGTSEQTHYKWRREYGGAEDRPGKRLKELERENERLKKAAGS
jgi:putative transposase